MLQEMEIVVQSKQYFYQLQDLYYRQQICEQREDKENLSAISRKLVVMKSENFVLVESQKGLSREQKLAGFEKFQQIERLYGRICSSVLEDPVSSSLKAIRH
jgi:hypothetical protein